MFGTTPANGLLIRHAEGIEVSDFKIVAQTIDARPCIIVDDVEHIDFFNVKPDRASDRPVFVLNNVRDFSVMKCSSLADTQVAETKHKEL